MASPSRTTANNWSRFLRVLVHYNDFTNVPDPQGAHFNVYTSSGGWGTSGKAPQFFPALGVVSGYEAPLFLGRTYSACDPRIVQPSRFGFNLEPFREAGDTTPSVRWLGEEAYNETFARIVYASSGVNYDAGYAGQTPSVATFPAWFMILPQFSRGIILSASLQGRNIVAPPFIFFGANLLRLDASWRQSEFRFSTPFHSAQHHDIWYVSESGVPLRLAFMVLPLGPGIGGQSVYFQRDSSGQAYATVLSGAFGGLPGSVGTMGVYYTHCVSAPIDLDEVPGHICASSLPSAPSSLWGGFKDGDGPPALRCREPIMDIGELVVTPYLQDAMPSLTDFAKHAAYEFPVYRRLYGGEPISFPGAGYEPPGDVRSLRLPDGTDSQILATADVNLVQLRTRAALVNNLPLSDTQLEMPCAPSLGAVAFRGTVIRGVRIEFIPWVTSSNPTNRTHGTSCTDFDLEPLPEPWQVGSDGGGGTLLGLSVCTQEIAQNATFDEHDARAGVFLNRDPYTLFGRVFGLQYVPPGLSGVAFDCGPDPALPDGAFRYAGRGPRVSRSGSTLFDTTVPPECPPPAPPVEPPPTPPGEETGCCVVSADAGESQDGGAGSRLTTTQAACLALGGTWTGSVDCSGNPYQTTEPRGPDGACTYPRSQVGTGGVGQDGGSQFGGAGQVGDGRPRCGRGPGYGYVDDTFCIYLSEQECSQRTDSTWHGAWSGCHETGLFDEWSRTTGRTNYDFDFRTDHVEIYAQLGAAIYSPETPLRPNFEQFVSTNQLENAVSLLGLRLSYRSFGTTRAIGPGQFATPSGEVVLNGEYLQRGQLSSDGGDTYGGEGYCNSINPGFNRPLQRQSPNIVFSPAQTQALLDGDAVIPTKWTDADPTKRLDPVLITGTWPARRVRDYITGLLDIGFTPQPLHENIQHSYAIRVSLLPDAPSPGTPGPHVELSCPPPNPFI